MRACCWRGTAIAFMSSSMKFVVGSSILAVLLSFSAQANTCSSLLLKNSASQSDVVSTFQDHRLRLLSEIERTRDVHRLTSEEYRYIRQQENLPSFTSENQTIEIYQAHLEFLLKGINRKLGLIFAAQISELTRTEITELTRERLSKWLERVDKASRLTHDDFNSLVRALAMNLKLNELAQPSLVDYFVLRNLFWISNSIGIESRELMHDASALKYYVENNRLEDSRRHYEKRNLPVPNPIDVPKVLELISSFETKKNQLLIWKQEADSELEALATRVGFYRPEMGQLWDVLYKKLNKDEEIAGSCCGHGCDSCTFTRVTTVNVVRKTAVQIKWDRKDEEVAEQPSLVYYSAKRALEPYLPELFFRLIGNPAALSRALSEIRP
jgi:hypothetical protein